MVSATLEYLVSTAGLHQCGWGVHFRAVLQRGTTVQRGPFHSGHLINQIQLPIAFGGLLVKEVIGVQATAPFQASCFVSGMLAVSLFFNTLCTDWLN